MGSWPEVRTRMGSEDVLEVLCELFLRHWKPEFVRSELPMDCATGSSNHWQRPRTRIGGDTGMLEKVGVKPIRTYP